MNDAAGHPLSGCTARGLEHLERALHLLRSRTGSPLAAAEAAIDAAPELVMAHVLRAWMHLFGTRADEVAPARESLAVAEALPHDAREAAHLRAAGLYCAGRWRAAALVLEDLSIEHPLDALALQVGLHLDFLTGDTPMLRDRVARVLPAWSPAVPGWHAVLAMYAYGLEENGDYALAERIGREVIAHAPGDGWAQHAVVHVLEMQQRRDDGIDWMLGNAGWREGESLVGVHNWWHLALHHVAGGDFDAALAIHDGPIAGHSPAGIADLIDASSLLWRVELAGGDAGARWPALAARWAALNGAGGYYAFNDLHAAMAYARAGRDDLLHALVEAQHAALESGTDNAGFVREVGLPAILAVAAHAAGDHGRAVELLRPIRNRSQRMGGSRAQRDVIDLTLIGAARDAGRGALARVLRTERDTLARQRREAAAAQACLDGAPAAPAAPA